MKKRLFWQLLPSYLVISLVLILISLLFTSVVIREFYFKELKLELRNRAYIIQEVTKNYLAPLNAGKLQSFAQNIHKTTSTRVTMILPTGKVFADSEEYPEKMNNHKTRPEIIQALKGQVGTSVRYSTTLKKYMMYVAIPVKSTDKVTYIIRTALPLIFIDDALRASYLKILAEALLSALIALGASYYIARKISKPLENLELGANKFAEGDLKFRLDIPKTKEIGTLALAMNKMAKELDGKIFQITQQTKELEVILASLEEGVIAVDTKNRIFKLNKKASTILGISQDKVISKDIRETLKNTSLVGFISTALSTDEHLQEEILISKDGKESTILAYSSILKNTEEKIIGALIVLNDVTHIKKLERVRRDFIANVSHELRTPITSIKGYAEALIDGAVDNREQGIRFANTILNQSNRLNNIIEDLLSLSRLEQDSRESELNRETVKICEVLSSAIQICSIKAENSDISIELNCDENITANINQSLIEQVVVNLIDNAIKYSQQGEKVHISAEKINNEIVINVADNGCGIPEKHLPRIFERFYRVDKARSRKLGGTGLGLAIVKHISHAHGGYASVESEFGKGSVFSVHLPLV